MKAANYDELGRIEIPSDILEQCGIEPNQCVKIMMEMDARRLTIVPTDEERPAHETMAAKKERTQNMKRLHPDKWQYIRALDTKNALVLPFLMRSALGWTTDTELMIEACDRVIYF